MQCNHSWLDHDLWWQNNLSHKSENWCKKQISQRKLETHYKEKDYLCDGDVSTRVVERTTSQKKSLIITLSWKKLNFEIIVSNMDKKGLNTHIWLKTGDHPFLFQQIDVYTVWKNTVRYSIIGWQIYWMQITGSYLVCKCDRCTKWEEEMFSGRQACNQIFYNMI